MVRKFLCSAAILALMVACAAAADKDAKPDKDKDKAGKNENEQQATIAKVDAKKGTITLKMKDKNGKETEKTFTLADDIRYFDSTGKVVAIDVFKSGDEVLVIEREGKLHRVKKHEKSSKEPKKDEKKTDKKDSGK